MYIIQHTSIVLLGYGDDKDDIIQFLWSKKKIAETKLTWLTYSYPHSFFNRETFTNISELSFKKQLILADK